MENQSDKLYLNDKNVEDPTNGLGIEISFKEDGDFLKIKETLTRMGVSSKHDKILYQSCHILHKRGKFYIMHFKELFILDGKFGSFNEQDRGRRNTITRLLEEWGLLKVVDGKRQEKMDVFLPMNQLKILPYKEKENWTLAEKYSVGNKGNNK